MALLADTRALLMGLSAPLVVRHGAGLDFHPDAAEEPDVWKVPTRHGTVRCLVHRPRSTGRHAADTLDARLPAYVHLHGGGFLMRYPQMDDFFVHHVVARTGAAVVNVDYGVAPRHRYPVAQEQAHDVVAWLAEHGAEEGVDGTRIAVGGFSAGGNVAASACLQLRDSGAATPRFQLLTVPSLDITTMHKPTSNPRPMIDARLLRLVRSTYFRDESRRSEPYASPVRSDDLHGLPPTMIVTAGLDALRAEGDAYAAQLAEAGVPVEHVMVPGRDHYVLDGPVDDARALMDRMADAVGDHLVA
ncbi:hypothetical protein ASD11_06730 [Aeromicrobium sp. Root495]|nr:hypothetical protein ASD11_06730 [Aeromicrobium sp. Root495]